MIQIGDVAVVEIQFSDSRVQKYVILNHVDWIIPQTCVIDPFKVLKRVFSDNLDFILSQNQFVQFQFYLWEAVLNVFYSIVG